MFTNGLNVGFLLRAQIKQSVHWVETHCFTGNFLAQWSVKKLMLTVFWDIKGPFITIDFLEKGATVNSASYCQILRQYFTLFIERPSYHSLEDNAQVESLQHYQEQVSTWTQIKEFKYFNQDGAISSSNIKSLKLVN